MWFKHIARKEYYSCLLAFCYCYGFLHPNFQTYSHDFPISLPKLFSKRGAKRPLVAALELVLVLYLKNNETNRTGHIFIYTVRLKDGTHQETNQPTNQPTVQPTNPSQPTSGMTLFAALPSSDWGSQDAQSMSLVFTSLATSAQWQQAMTGHDWNSSDRRT